MHAMQTKQMIRILSSIGRGLLMALLAWLALLALIAAMVIVQGQHDDARPVGAVVVLGEPAARRFEHAGALYRRGLVSRIILSGASAVESGRQHLTGQGLPAQALLLDTESDTLAESIRAAATLARSQGVSTVLIVADPSQMLAALKIARDEGLTAYGSPARSTADNAPLDDIVTVWHESWVYLIYLFTGQ